MATTQLNPAQLNVAKRYNVINDRHFRELERYDFPKVDVRTLAEFRDIIRNL